MANPWFRLWADMANDPKWRTIARVSKQEISRVISVYLHMMTCASNADERGRLQGWCDEDVATALDIELEDVEAIRRAMEGRVLDGDYLAGWEKRQPKREREDTGSTERSREFRAKQSNATPCNATQHQETPREEEIRVDTDNKEQKTKTEPTQRASRLPADWSAPDDYLDFCKAERKDLDPMKMQAKFRDYWTGVPGKQGLKLDWAGTWRNFIRSERAAPQARASPSYPAKNDRSGAAAAIFGAPEPMKGMIDVN